MKTIGYIRCSTTGQADEGVTLEAQAKAIEAYCTMRGLDLVEIICDEAISGSTSMSDREGGKQLINAVNNGKAQHVVSYKLDRLFRDAANCLQVTNQWESKGVSLHLIDMGGQSIDTATAMGRFFLTVMAEGKRVGSIPYGYDLHQDSETLIENIAEQKVIAVAKELRESGLSLRAIATELAKRGFTTRNGKGFLPAQVSRLTAA